jgi:glycine oxidase
VKSADVIVVGAGIVGLSAARHLAARGARVRVVERTTVGAEASGAAAGLLAPQVELEGDWPLLPLAVEARSRYASLLSELAAETGIAVELSGEGLLEVALDDVDLARLDRQLAWQRGKGLPVERLTASGLREAEPGLGPRVRGGLLMPEDRRLDNVALTRALAASAARRGVEILTGRPVRGLRVAGGRVSGVELGDDTLEASAVVNAAGAWLGGLAGDPEPPPVHPVRGQMVALDGAPSLRHAVVGPRGYLVPREGGRVIAGSTLEQAGFVKAVTVAGVRSILDGVLEILPALDEAPVAGTWSGLRPGTPDGLPVLGPGAAPGLVHAGGLYRNGILLGPLVGEIAAALTSGEPSPYDISAFAPCRFQAVGR